MQRSGRFNAYRNLPHAKKWYRTRGPRCRPLRSPFHRDQSQAPVAQIKKLGFEVETVRCPKPHDMKLPKLHELVGSAGSLWHGPSVVRFFPGET
jgi:hypothetical protein